MNEQVFTSLTHGLSPDCRLANAQLKETLDSYNFGAFLMETSCSKCPNDDCNTSFMLILQKRDFMRLRRQVAFNVRPTFLVHRSFSELIEADHRIRRRLLADNSVGIQVGPEMTNKLVDACPPVQNIQSQTDFMVCRRDAGYQTEHLDRHDATCQVAPLPPILDFSVVQRADTYSLDINNNNNSNKNPSSSTLEIQLESDDDDEVVVSDRGVLEDSGLFQFVEIRPGAPRVAQEVKQEPEEVPVSVVTLVRAREIKTEVFEPVLEEPEVHEEHEEQEGQEQLPVKQEEPDEEGEEESSPSSPSSRSSPQQTASSSTIFSPLASAFSSLNTNTFYTPNNTSSSTSGGSSAKRVKYSDIEICQRCFDVTYFEKLGEYVSHILESHVAISRFKCTVCDKRFGNSVAAGHHTRCHDGQGDGPAEFVSDLSGDSVHKFLATANACYTDKFRNIQSEEIAEIIKKLP